MDVDPGRREVRVTVRSGGSRRARYTGDQGCVIVPEHGEISFRPVLVRTALPAAATQPWPMGDAPTTPHGRPTSIGARSTWRWRAPGDERGAIRIVDLLRMSSGLRCTSPFDPDRSPGDGYPDHLLVYTGAIDAFAFALARPLQFPPGTEGRYRNCDPLAVGWLVEEAVRRRGEEILTFPQRALFDRIGIRRQVLETDPYGHFLLNGHDYGTARNWARLGLLYLRDGRWGGERVLPEGWSAFVSTPAPAWRLPIYGAFVWLNRAGQLRLPIDAYFMLGAGGQYTIVVPSRELVVVRMGHQRGGPRAEDALNDALEGIAAALPRVGTGGTRRPR